MAEHSRPWAVPKDTTDPAELAKRVLSEEQHRAFLGGVLGSGVINARTGAELNVLADGTSVLRLQPGEYLIDGIYYWNDAEKLFNVATIGAQPAVGQSRIDNLVMRLNPTDKEVTAELVAGVPSTSPANPALNRGPSHSGTYEDVIRSWRWTGQGLTQVEIDAGDRRSWLGPHLTLADAASLYPNTVDLGTTARRRGSLWFRELVDGAPQWVEQPPNFGDQVGYVAGARMTNESSFVKNTSSPGLLTLPAVIPARPYPRLLDATAAALPIDATSEGTSADHGFRVYRIATVNGRRTRVLESDRTKLVRQYGQKVQTEHSRTFGPLEPGVEYEVEWTVTTAAGAVRYTADPRFTYLEVRTRGCA